MVTIKRYSKEEGTGSQCKIISKDRVTGGGQNEITL